MINTTKIIDTIIQPNIKIIIGCNNFYIIISIFKY